MTAHRLPHDAKAWRLISKRILDVGYGGIATISGLRKPLEEGLQALDDAPAEIQGSGGDHDPEVPRDLDGLLRFR